MTESQRLKHKKLINAIVRLDVIKDEIAYAKTQIQDHDTGHIYTAISWMEHRIEELEKHDV